MNDNELERHSTIVTVRFGLSLPFAWMGVGMLYGWTEAMVFGPLSLICLIVLSSWLRYLNGDRDFVEIDRSFKRQRRMRREVDECIAAVRAEIAMFKAEMDNTANDCSDELVEDMIEHATLTPVPEKPNGDDVQPEANYREPAVQHVCRCGKLSHHG